MFKTRFTNQAEQSSFFRLPLEVRQQVYSYLIGDTNIHVETLAPYMINDAEEVAVFYASYSEVVEMRGGIYGYSQYDSHREKVKEMGQTDQLRLRSSLLPRSLKLEAGRGYRTMFHLYRCVSTKPFLLASACPPGQLDHADCGRVKEPLTHAIRRTCQQAYADTGSVANLAKAAFHFDCLKDVVAFSMLLTDDQRESIPDLRINLDVTDLCISEDVADQMYHSTHQWLYFCNVFGTPWDRRNLRSYLGDSNIPSHKAEISFSYNKHPSDLSNNNEKALASSWVAASIGFRWQVSFNYWGTRCDLSDLRAREPISVRFAIPLYLVTTEDNEINFQAESYWDDAKDDVVNLGDEGHVRFAERRLIEECVVEDLVDAKKAVLSCNDPDQREELQRSYDEMFRNYWLEPRFRLNHVEELIGSWKDQLDQGRQFSSFEMDFYDESGPRSSLGLDILRDGLKKRFTTLSPGPHPCLMFRN